MTAPADSKTRRCAVIYNPLAVSAEFRGLVEAALQRAGFGAPMWLETSAADAGQAMTKQAVDARVDLVIGAGGDGTIRMIADGLAGTGIPLGLIPAGTGNLLARNLELPLDEVAALDGALSGRTRTIDLIRLSVDGGNPEHFAVMAGVGLDAMIMDETDPKLKKKVGSAAYFIAAGKALGRLPVTIRVTVDDHRPLRRHAMLCVIGNVGELRGKITLIPQAKPDDGLLDVYIASPRRVTHWLKMALRLITRRPQKDDQVDQVRGTRVTVRVEGKDNYQLDGDAVGECTTLTAEVQPGALTLCVPG